MGLSENAWLSTVQIALALLLSLDILLHKHRPVSAVLWLGVVWSFPILGALGYVFFGIDRIRWLEVSAKRAAIRAPIRARGDTEKRIADSRGAHIFQITEPAILDYRVRAGNRAELLVDGEAFYPALREAIESAERSIDLQSFIISPDRTGAAMLALLQDRAKDGVHVRVLYDRFGSTVGHFTGFFRRARQDGLEIRSNRTWGHINLRNHRKVAVIDGRVGFVGGLNIDDRNTTERAPGGPDRDYHVRLEGPVVSDLQLMFSTDWASATRTPLQSLGEPDPEMPSPEPEADALVQVIPGGPGGSGSGLAQAYFGAIAAAKKSVTVVTPYFLPNDAIFEALRYSALRGLDVRIVLPAKSNHWYTVHAARARYAPLLRSTVRIFERRPPFMHAKALIIDGLYAMLGSANLDYRSLHLNFELNIEIVDDLFVGTVREQVAKEIARSREISLSEHESRSLAARLAQNVCYLLQPVL